MTSQEKTVLLALIRNGKIQDAIKGLEAADLSKSKRKEALTIASRYQRLKSQNRSGVLSFEQAITTENQIVDHLIELINFSDDQTYPTGKSIDSSNTALPNKEKISLQYKIGIIGCIASFIGLLLYLLPLWDKHTPQLTVYVTDIHGNVVLEHEGELNTSIGNRPMRETIGEHGRTNFGDILPKYLGNSITIGFKAEGWELVNPVNTFTFDGKPIHLKIRKDSSLGLIKGIVKTRNGQDFIEGAKVLINADTIVFTDANGMFNVLLPEKMRVNKATDGYKLTVTKNGYHTKTEYFYPKSTDAEIRMEKYN